MRSSNKNILTTALAALAVALFLARFIAISNHYPFYLLWDMDFVTMVDTLLINSGLRPDHLNHPCFGMYLIQTLAERASHGLGGLSAIRLDELNGSLNPLSAVAELTRFLRLMTPFLETGFILFLWSALCLVLRPGRWIALLFLLMLGMQESLLYHAAMIRTEMVAMTYWSAALLLAAVAARARREWALNAAMAGAGVLLGLCFLSKVQAVLHLAAFVALELLFFSIADRPGNALRAARATRTARRFVIAGAVNLVLFIVMILAAWGVPIDVEAGGVFVSKDAGFAPNPFAFAFLLGGAALAGGQAWLFLKGRGEGPAFRLMNVMTLVFSGFLGSFLLGFLMFGGPGAAADYIRVVFKMVFLRELESQQKYSYIIINPLGLIAYQPLLYLVHFALLLTLVLGWVNKFLRIRAEQVALAAASSLLLLAMLWLTVRYFLRDLLWVEPLLNVLNAVYFMLIWRGAAGRKAMGLRTGAAAALAAALLMTSIAGLAMPRRIDMNVNKLGYNIDFWQKGIYKKNHPKYTEVMAGHYGEEEWKVARRVAGQALRNRAVAETVFQNQPVTHRAIGTVSEGFPVWTGKQDWKIAAFPETLREAVVVDSASMPALDRYFSREAYVREHSEYLDKVKPAPGKGVLSILPRNDVKVLLFVQAGDLARLTGGAGGGGMKITLRRGGEAVELYGLEIRDYTELPVNQFSQDYFFVLAWQW